MVRQATLRYVILILAALMLAALACTPAPGNEVEQSGEEEEVRVVTATPEPPAPPPPEPAAGEAQPSGASTIPSANARANQIANIREKPDPNCPLLGSVPTNQQIVLLRRTTSTTDTWYETDYLGTDSRGWVYEGPLTLLDDDSTLPAVPAEGCAVAAAPAASCGDGSCNSGETCQTCTADCGACPVAPGACPSGPGNCCGDGTCQTDEDASWCGDCEAAPVCGNGTCDAGENATLCAQDCTTGSICGNGNVEPGEECDPPEAEPPLPPGGGSVSWCNATCTMSGKTGGGGIPGGCGNNSCEAGENTCTCPNDCPGVCTEVVDPCAVNPLAPGCLDPCIFLDTC